MDHLVIVLGSYVWEFYTVIKFCVKSLKRLPNKVQLIILECGENQHIEQYEVQINIKAIVFQDLRLIRLILYQE